MMCRRACVYTFTCHEGYVRLEEALVCLCYAFTAGSGRVPAATARSDWFCALHRHTHASRGKPHVARSWQAEGIFATFHPIVIQSDMFRSTHDFQGRRSHSVSSTAPTQAHS